MQAEERGAEIFIAYLGITNPGRGARWRMQMSRNGLHHVTAISGPARRNVDFYTRILGLRLVKKTVTSTIPARTTSTMATAPLTPAPS